MKSRRNQHLVTLRTTVTYLAPASAMYARMSPHKAELQSLEAYTSTELGNRDVPPHLGVRPKIW
jgi:hypothetical protein